MESYNNKNMKSKLIYNKSVHIFCAFLWNGIYQLIPKETRAAESIKSFPPFTQLRNIQFTVKPK